MTDDNQQQETPQFGSGGKQEPNDTQGTPQFKPEEVEQLLKRNTHAQTHIKTLESETAELRAQLREMQEELARSKSIEDYLEQMRQQDTDTNVPGSTAPQLDKNELLAQVKEEVFNELTAAQRAEVEQRNWQETENLLKQKYGERYGFYVDERAKQLDMTNEEMEALAKTKPKLFMELMGEKRTGTPSPTQSSQMSLPNTGDNLEVMYTRVQRLRRNLDTEEGREAARMWADPAFQAKYRQHILEKARQEGKF